MKRRKRGSENEQRMQWKCGVKQLEYTDKVKEDETLLRVKLKVGVLWQADDDYFDKTSKIGAEAG